MENEESKYKLNMAVPNGIILGLIGTLALLTPFVTEVPENQRTMDFVAGVILTLGGLVSLLWGLHQRFRAAVPDSTED